MAFGCLPSGHRDTISPAAVRSKHEMARELEDEPCSSEALRCGGRCFALHSLAMHPSMCVHHPVASTRSAAAPGSYDDVGAPATTEREVCMASHIQTSKRCGACGSQAWRGCMGLIVSAALMKPTSQTVVAAPGGGRPAYTCTPNVRSALVRTCAQPPSAV